jgi:cytochrome b6-f complex iron-sulfur subunit
MADLEQGLFFPGQQAAATAAAPTAPAVPRPVRPDPTAEAAAAVRARPKRHFLSRRLALRWAGWGTILAVLAGWGNGFLQFFYPHKTGAFGGTITAATTSELKVGDVKVLPDGKFYLSHVAEGYLALWWKCPHLGCTVPWKESEPAIGSDVGKFDKGEFHCPCHGSQYDRYGQIIAGPAPRPMDAFPVTFDGDKIKVDTGPTKAITRERSGPDSPVIAKA